MENSKNILKDSCLFRMVMKMVVFVTLFAHSFSAYSQVGTIYPVEINAMLTPPYGTCLTDYVGTNRFQCNVLMRDMHATGYKFRILMTVKDLASGRVMFAAQSDIHTVTPGMPTYMAETGVFAEFFKPENILVSTVYKDGCLKEGSYNFVFQVVDARDTRRIPISKECVFPARLVAGGAPLLISPFTGTNIECGQTFVNFTWQMPIVTGEQTKYLIEICPTDEGGNGLHYLGGHTPSANGVGPSQGYIRATSYMPMYQLLESAEKKFETNTTYFWRVSIIDEFGNVKPNSTSEIDSFTYCYTKELEPYTPLKEPKVKAINGELDTVHIDTVKTEDNATNAYWILDDVRFKYQSYALDVRKKSQDTWTTYYIEIKEGDPEERNYYGLSNLKYNELYEARMQYLLITEGDTSYAPYSDTIEFKVPNPMDTADCGEIMAIKDCDGAKGRILKKYDTLYANGTPVVLDSIIYKAGDSTVISGFGVVSFPILKNFKLKMKFNEVSVNCYGELISGQVVSVYNESTGAIIDLNHLLGKGDGGGSQSTNERPEPTKYNDKKEAQEKMPVGGYAQIGDSIYTKDKDGNIVALGKPLSLPADKYTNNNNLDDDDVYCIFRNDTKDAPYIGFDADEKYIYRKVASLRDHYQSFSKQEGADNPYIIPYVASNPGRVVKLSATLEGRLIDEYDKESVKFIMPMSGGDYLDLNAKKEGDRFIVDFPGGQNPDTNSDVYAIVKKGDKYVNVGKINIETYAWRKQKVKIVPVVNDYSVDEKAISETLNRIYGRFGITYEVTKDDRFNTAEINAGFVDDFSVGTGILTKQSDDMKLLQRCYKKERDFKDSTAYLFLLNSAKENSSIEGDMPQGQICGYIFMHSDNGTLSDGRLVAHELAHGIYKLDHVFEPAYGITEKTTDNLLDYNNGDQLAHFQWELIKNPGFAWTLLESDEDNMFKESQIFFDPDWRPFTFTQSSIIYYDKNVKDNGVIPGLSLSKYGSRDYVFNPNLHKYENKDVQNDVLTVQYVSENDLNGSDAVYLYYANPENLCDSRIYKTTYDYVKKAKESIKNGSAFSSGNKNLKFIQYVNCVPAKSGLFELESEFSKGNLSLLKKLSHKTDVPLYEMEEIVDCLSSKVNSDYDEKLLGERLVDKLKVYEQMNGKKFRVVFCDVNTVSLSQKSWNQLAEVVFEKSNLGPNDILVTIPYVGAENIARHGIKYPYYMVGYHCGSKVDVDFSKINGPYDNSINTDGVIRFVGDLFTHTSKKWVIVDGVFASTNVVSTSVMSSTEDISGLNFNRQIRLWREKGFSKLQQIVQEGNDKISRAFFDYCFCVSNTRMSYKSLCDDAREKYNQLKLEYSAKAEEQLELMYNFTQNSTFEEAFELYQPSYEYFLDIKEEFLLSENEKYSDLEIGKLIQKYAECSEGDVLEYGYDVKEKDLRYIKSNAYSYIYTDAFNELREVLKGVKKTDAFKFKTDIAFNGEDYYWRPVDKVVYGSIDAASCLLGFVGFDFIADGVGFSYAVFRGDPLQASIYAISLAVEGPGAVTALKELKNIKKGQNSFFWKKKVGVEKTSAEDEVKRASELIEGIKTVNDKLLDRFEAIVKNDPSLQNAYKNIFESKLVAESAERRKFVEEFSEASDDLLKKILQNDKSVDVWKASIKDGYAMSSNQRKALVSDFVDGSLNDLIGNSSVIKENWIPTWKKLYKLNVDKNVRSCGVCIETLRNAFSKYPDIDISNISRVLGPQKNPVEFVTKNYQTVKSEAHYRTLVGDFDNVPGVKKASYVGNGLPEEPIKAPDDWSLNVRGKDVNLDLPDWTATTFTSVEPKKLAPGTTIYRVYGDGQYASGGFWTYDLPKNEAELYGGTAVQPSWNNHTRYVEYTVPEGVDVYVWEGPVARQRVIDGVTDGYCLEGGTTQLYICRDVTENVMGIEGKAGNDFVFGAVSVADDVIEGALTKIRNRFKAIVDNEPSLKNAYQNIFDSKLVAGSAERQKFAEEFSDASDELLKKILQNDKSVDVWKTSIKDGYAIDATQRKALVSDFVDGSLNDLIGNSPLNINEDWIPTWKKLYEAKVDKNVRSCGVCVDILQKALSKYPDIDISNVNKLFGEKLTPGSNELKLFADEFGKAVDDGFKTILENVSLVDTWKSLVQYKVSEVVRKDIKSLQILHDAFSKYPDIDISNISRVLEPQEDPLKYVAEKYQTVKSEAHYRTLVGDFDNVPGVKKTSYVRNGLPKKEIKAPNDWSLSVNGKNVKLDLPDWAAETFTSVEPKKLAPGTTIYRVYGDGQYATGGFWTYDLPKNEAELYGGTAVQPAWNNHTRYVEYTVPDGVDVYVWEGPVARQPVIEGVTDGYCLEGGTTQLYISRDVTENVMGIEGKSGDDFVFGVVPTKKKDVGDEVDDLFSSLKNNNISLSDALATVYSWEQDLKRACEIMESAKRKGCSWYDDILKKVLRKEVTCDELTSAQIKHLTDNANKYAKNVKDVNGDMVFFATNGDEALRITKEGFLIMPAKGKRYPAREIWKDSYVDMRLNELKKDGVGFVMRKNQDCVNSRHDGQVPRKFVGNYKKIKEVIEEANGDLSYIAKKLDLGDDYFKGSDELYFVKVDLNKGYTIDLPDGNEPGAYEFLWWTGGDTKNLTPEAVFVESGTLMHGKNWDKYLEFYGKDNVVKITEYNK